MSQHRLDVQFGKKNIHSKEPFGSPVGKKAHIISLDVIQVVIFNLILNVYYECNSRETSLSVSIVLIEKDV